VSQEKLADILKDTQDKVEKYQAAISVLTNFLGAI
jgi:hypothetical protein